MRLPRIAILPLLLALLAAPVASAIAHPHAWIDLRSTVVLDERGRVTAIEQEWLFDQFYSLFLTEDLDPALSEAEAYDSIARRAMSNLRAYDYFTVVRADGERQLLDDAEDPAAEMRAGRLWLRFTVPLSRPVDPRAEALDYAVYDPSYYIEILHMNGDMVSFRSAAAENCQADIQPPDPDPETVALAQALDRNAQADSSLGRVFAEQVRVSCR